MFNFFRSLAKSLRQHRRRGVKHYRPFIVRFFVSLLLFVHFTSALASTDGTKGRLDTDSIKVEKGWNLMSVPVTIMDGAKSSIFPTAISSAFIYQHGYDVADTLQNGQGFWLKFDSASTVSISGNTILDDTIAVTSGWNIIGSLTTPIAVDSIHSQPSGIIASSFFGYVPGIGYQITDTLEPGRGYWVKVSQSGSIILSLAGIAGSPCPRTPTVVYAGKTYNTVLIGAQCWLKENLDVGTMIQGTDTAKDNGTIERYCFNNDTANCRTYGGLYQWDEAMQYSTTPGTQGICPSGWHMPTMSEFQTLCTTVGGDGNALKAIGEGRRGGAGTNTSGFSALLAGLRGDGGYFDFLEYYALIWSSTQDSWTSARGLYLDPLSGYNSLDDDYKGYGFSVRCLKD